MEVFMKTKALLALLTAVCICGCATGCGSSDNENDLVSLPNNIINDKTESQNETLEIEKSENEESQNNDSAAENESDSETKIADEVLNEEMYTNVFQVGEKVIRIPMTAKELFDMDGVELAEDQLAGISQGQDPTTIIAEPSIYKVTIDGVKTSFYFNVTTEEEKQFLSDCNVMVLCNTKNVVFPKGVKAGMPIEEIRRLWGEPDIEEAEKLVYLRDMVTDTYVVPQKTGEDASMSQPYSYFKDGAYSSFGYSYEVYVDPKTKTVSSINFDDEYLIMAAGYTINSLDNFPKPDDNFSFSDKYMYPGSDHSFDIHYELPAYMGDNFSCCAYVYEDNGQKYAIHKNRFINTIVAELDLKEYTDDNLRKYSEEIVKDNNPQGMKDPELLTYSVKKDGYRAVIIFRDNTADGIDDKTRGNYSRIQVHCLDENFVDTIFSFVVAPCNGKESISDEELESADSWFYEFAKSVKTTRREN
jgi:hypothetical protein